MEPVPPCKVTWEQYINSAPKQHPTLARQILLEESSGQIKTTIGMVRMLVSRNKINNMCCFKLPSDLMTKFSLMKLQFDFESDLHFRIIQGVEQLIFGSSNNYQSGTVVFLIKIPDCLKTIIEA